MSAIRTAVAAWFDRHVPLMEGEASALDLLDRPRVVEVVREKVAA